MATKGAGVQRSSREGVLDAVADCVQDVGVKRTTMAEIARRAEMSRSTLYTHFSDVNQATAALLTRRLLQLMTDAAVEESEGSGRASDARARLVARARHLAARISADPLIERILDLDAELLVPYLVRRLGSSQRAILDTVTQLVADGQAEGSIRRGDPARIAFSTFLVVQSFVISSRIAEAEHGLDPVLDELELVLDRALRPTATEGAPS
jgi:AcrR family transcriptional regulator